MCTPRNLVLLTLSTVELSMVSGGWSTEFLLKSITTSFVLLTLRDRLLHTLFSQLCHFLSVSALSSLLLMTPTTDVFSVYLMMWLELNSAVQSWVSIGEGQRAVPLWGTCAQCDSARGVCGRHGLTEVLC